MWLCIAYIKQNLQQEPHTVGTNAMLPRNEGGVVSPQLKVYGTSNIRVVDVSDPIRKSRHTVI
jgi:choline dehydrogenase-like flavoprotein